MQTRNEWLFRYLCLFVTSCDGRFVPDMDKYTIVFDVTMVIEVTKYKCLFYRIKCVFTSLITY